MDAGNRRDLGIQKPRQVTYAFYLILGSTAIGFLGLIVDATLFWQERYSNQPANVICYGLLLLVPIWLAFKIDAGRLWARLVFTAYTLTGLLNIAALLRSFAAYPISATLNTISLTLSLLAIFFLFQSSSSAWLKTVGISTSFTREPRERAPDVNKQTERANSIPQPRAAGQTGLSNATVEQDVRHPNASSDSLPRSKTTESEKKGTVGPPQKASLIGFITYVVTDKKEAPSLGAFAQDWSGLNTLRRITWALRFAFYIGILVSLFLPWYQTDMDRPGSGWLLGLDLAGWSCGIFLIPYVALLLFGIWSTLRPRGRMIWAYRVSLLVWIAYVGIGAVDLAFSHSGPIVSLIIAALAMIVEVADYAIVHWKMMSS